MLTLRRTLTAIAALAMGFVATSSPAAASYVPGEHVDLTLVVSACTVGGTNLQIRATATSGGNALDGTITVKALGKTFTDNDNDIRISTKTPVVATRTSYTVTANFEPTDTAGFARPATEKRTATVVPRSVGCTPGSSGVLPNTGGLSLWYVILGGLLLVVGAGVLLISARKRSNMHS